MGNPNLPAGAQNEIEFVCLGCTIPGGCDESDPRCAYRKARPRIQTTSRWVQLFERVALLEPGDLLVEMLPAKEARSAQSSVQYQVRSGKLPPVVTWSIRAGNETALNILRRSK